MRRPFIAIALVISLLSTAYSFPLTIKDSVGRTVTIKEPVKRVVCLGPGALRLISYLESIDKVVGVEALEKRYPMGRPYRIAYPELESLPTVGPGGPESINKKPDMEAILRVSPDVIFVTYMEAKLADEVQDALGIPVVILHYGGQLGTVSEAVYLSLKIAGKILNKESRAENLISYIEGIKEDLQNRTKDIPLNKRPRVYVGGIGYRGSYGIESTEQHYIPLEWTNSINLAKQITATVGSHVFTDKEIIMRLDPDVIFLDGGGLELIREDFSKKPDYYKSLRAFQKGDVYLLLPFNYYATNIETVLIDAYVLGKVLYPDKFSDIAIEDKANEIYKFFLGKSVYEEMKKTYGEPGSKVTF